MSPKIGQSVFRFIVVSTLLLFVLLPQSTHAVKYTVKCGDRFMATGDFTAGLNYKKEFYTAGDFVKVDTPVVMNNKWTFKSCSDLSLCSEDKLECTATCVGNSSASLPVSCTDSKIGENGYMKFTRKMKSEDIPV